MQRTSCQIWLAIEAAILLQNQDTVAVGERGSPALKCSSAKHGSMISLGSSAKSPLAAVNPTLNPDPTASSNMYPRAYPHLNTNSAHNQMQWAECHLRGSLHQQHAELLQTLLLSLAWNTLLLRQHEQLYDLSLARPHARCRHSCCQPRPQLFTPPHPLSTQLHQLLLLMLLCSLHRRRCSCCC